ncbi:hypothetical protein [Amaricoccus solimangrovi]|uniref:Uncharacterized protein n=1 Tax=Amaricoccus solimangrovi TaxID=2589815 RepID=A0A501WMZ5_9RHOB|nr:hypothetical protein [Amaricoccus solimangrovi]TPE49715.1 hypothetical protein FJM51_13815 [Amaricoccus solimangrovi]
MNEERDKAVLARRLRLILHDALSRNDVVDSRLDRELRPVKGLREDVIGTRREIIFAMLFSCATAWILPYAVTWLLARNTQLPDGSLSLAFRVWTCIAVAFLTGTYVRGQMADRAIHWARREESASRAALSLMSLLDDLEAELPGSVPNLDRFRNFDLDHGGKSPLVDAALRGVGQ